MAPARYIFADLDALNQDVSTYMRAHPTEFSDAELMKRFPISARRLTKLLSQPSGAATHFRGSYYFLKLKDVEAFRAAGWEMRPKSAARNRTLGYLPKPTRYREDDVEEDKTLVLVAGKLTRSVLYGVDKYFEAGWCVQCYCFRDPDANVYDRLASEHPKHFKRFYLDGSVKRLIKDIAGSHEEMYAARSASPRGDAEPNTPSSYKLPGLYEYIHELQEKVLAMGAKSAAQRIKEHDDLHYQLQQQQEAFAHQLIKQDENFKKRLKQQQEEHQQHEQLVEQRVEVCATEVASALSSLGELSERVKQDIREFERARLDKELAHWRHDTTQSTEHEASFNRHSSVMNASLLKAIDVVFKQNGIETGVTNWRVALVMLVAHKVTAWSNYATDCIGILVTFSAILAIASCFAEAG